MSIIDDLQPSTTHFNPVSGKPYPLQVANPHTNVDVIHTAIDTSAGSDGAPILLYDFVPSDSTSIVSQDTCTPFLRTVKDGVTTDTDLDGQPYTVVGEVRAHCPDAQTEPACNCADELQALQASVDSIAALFAETYISPTYRYHTSTYTVRKPYKSLTVTFINEGAINGMYAPAGYSFSHPREINGTYYRDVMLDGTGFAVWEDR